MAREGLSREDAMLKRVVQERVRRSRKRNKFSLDDDDGGLTHGVSSLTCVLLQFHCLGGTHSSYEIVR